VGNLDRIRRASQISLSVLLPPRDRIGAARVDVALLVGVKPRTNARARTVVIPSSLGLEPTMLPGRIVETPSQAHSRGLSVGFALVLAMLAVLAFVVTRSLA
jgi:hypothetical protein